MDINCDSGHTEQTQTGSVVQCLKKGGMVVCRKPLLNEITLQLPFEPLELLLHPSFLAARVCLYR